LSALKRLAGETAIYGIPSIIGRFLGFLMTPVYTWMFLTGEYGILSNVLAYVAFLQVLLTYGMETSYFRFAGRSNEPEKVFSTALVSLSATSFLFVLLVAFFSKTLATWVGYPQNHIYIVWMGITVAIDAITSIPFARLRLQRRPVKFAIFKLINIGLTIFLNIFWIIICPKIIQSNPDSIVQYVYSSEIGIGYAFLAYLVSSLVTLFLFLPDFFSVNIKLYKNILVQMLHYGWPILIVGLAGMVNMNIEKILLPELIRNVKDPIAELGVYAANAKLAVLMTLFIQAFRFSFEPFLFSHYKNEDSKKVYVVIMNYFVIMGLIIFLGVMFYIDYLKYFAGPEKAGYHEGLKVVPWLLLGDLFLGVFYTQSLWYKLTDQTHFGAKFAVLGALITLLLNVIFIPSMGYMASAIAFFTASLVMTVVSYFVGQKYFPVKYDLKKIGSYFLVALILFVIEMQIKFDFQMINVSLKTFLLFLFLIYFWHNEKADLKGAFGFRKQNTN
jgi:O-antigen/teichoic acid export membrane protein